MSPVRLLILTLLAAAACAQAQETETIVCLRHGEKYRNEIGQLNAQGLNRSLALPDVLLPRFGRPQYIFAPDPALDLIGPRRQTPTFDYVRPLATIEPTAIRCALPVCTMFGFRNTQGLETELLKPPYHQAVIFVCWEHLKLAEFLAQMVADLNHTPLQKVDWPSPDFDSLYILRIHYAPEGASVTLTHEQEGLNGLSDHFPRPAP